MINKIPAKAMINKIPAKAMINKIPAKATINKCNIDIKNKKQDYVALSAASKGTCSC